MGGAYTWREQQSNIKGGNSFGKKKDEQGITLGYNPAGHCPVLSDLWAFSSKP